MGEPSASGPRAPAPFRWLLALLPRAFREEYGEELREVAEEHARAVLGPHGGRLRRVGFWTRESLAVLRQASRLRRTPSTGGEGTMEGLLQDVRYAARSLRKRPGFTFVTVLTLGLGIGATTAIFSALRAVLLRELPYGAAEDVVVLFQTDLATGERGDGVSAANIADLAASARRFTHVAVAEPWSLDLLVDGRAQSLQSWAVSRGFFEAVGAAPLLGRTFADDEYQEGNARVVVLGHRAWVGRFGAHSGIVGTDIQLDGQPHTVVGVLPSRFKLPEPADLWVPRPTRPWDAQGRGADFMMGVARLAPGASAADGQDEMDRLAAELAASYPDTNAGVGIRLVPLREHLFGDVRTPLLVIMGAVSFVLLIACANVTGLMLARGAQRQREYALRGALGAGAARLFRLLTLESLLIAGAGCGLGLAVTWAGVRAIQALGPDHLPRIDELSVDGAVLVFAVVVAGMSALLSGLAPALRLSRPDVRAALSEGGRGSSTGPAGSRLRGRLVVAQVAAAVVLLIGAGLLIRSFSLLVDKELGFDPSGKIALQVFAYDYASNAERWAFVQEVRAGMEALPGVAGVALTSDLPGATDGSIAKIDIQVPFTFEGRPAPPPGQEPITAVSSISEGFFELMDMPLVAGRDLAATDDASGVPVIVVNEALARRHFGDADPLGESLTVQFGRAVPREIVGVVADVRPLGYESEPRPEVYFPLAQVPSGSLTFVLEGEGGVAPPSAPLVEVVWSANPAQSVSGVATLASLLADWMRARRFNLIVLTGFATVALVLSAVGMYGLISFSVERRRSELGIRRALGGRSRDLIAMVLREGLALSLAGVAIGLLGAAYLSRFLRGMLVEVEATDPWTFVALPALVLAVTTASTVVPAWRAIRADPVEALRSE